MSQPVPGPVMVPGKMGPGGHPSDPTLCFAYHDLKFCSYGLDCDYRHDGPSKTADIQTLAAELRQMGMKHTQGIYQCMVCGAHREASLEAKVGETYSYQFCGKCGNFYFYPHVQLIVLQILADCGTDYMKYKKQVDEHAKRLPQILQIPFMYEAHRWATSRFAWSLTSPDNAKDLLQLVFREHPSCRRLFSMGSGTGYVEHTFLHAAEDIGHPLEIHAFDAAPQKPPEKRIVFDVPVEEGGVERLKEFGDLSDSVLLLCWPPFGSQSGNESQMAFDALTLFAELGGMYLIYIGDVNATGDWKYHELLASHWALYEEVHEFKPIDVWVPEKMGLIYAGNDTMNVYKKREVPLQVAPFTWKVTA